jgi:hypothetical protein
MFGYRIDSFADMRRLQLKFDPSINPSLRTEGALESANTVTALSAKCEVERNFYMYAFALALFMYALFCMLMLIFASTSFVCAVCTG